MNERDRDGSFFDRRRYALYIAGSHVAHSEDPGAAGLEQEGRSRDRPLRSDNSPDERSAPDARVCRDGHFRRKPRIDHGI